MKSGDIIVGAAMVAVLVGAGIYILPTIPSAAKYTVTAISDPAAVLPKPDEFESSSEKVPIVGPVTVPLLANAPHYDFEEIRRNAGKVDDHPAKTEKRTLAAYDQLNSPDSPGYAEGRLAVQLFVYDSTANDRSGTSWEQAAAFNARAAREKGSQDPLVAAIEGTFCFECPIFCGNAKPHYKAHRDAVLRLQESAYPPNIKMVPLLAAMKNLKRYSLSKYQNGPVLEYGPKFRKAGLQLLEQYLKKESYPERVYRGSAIRLAQYTTYEAGIREAYEREIENALVSHHAPPEVLPAVRGQYLVDRAWNARGSGWANTVTPEAERAMAEHLAAAERELEAGWQKFPNAAPITDLLMTVELGQGRGRSRMERYFQGSIKADPGRYNSYEKKMQYLQPRWYGSKEDILAFGQQCLESGEWETNVPLVLIDAIDALENSEPDIYEDPEARNLLRKMFTDYLARHPNSVWQRGYYLKFLLKIGDLKEARKQDELLRDWWDIRLYSPEEREEIRRKLKRF